MRRPDNPPLRLLGNDCCEHLAYGRATKSAAAIWRFSSVVSLIFAEVFSLSCGSVPAAVPSPTATTTISVYNDRSPTPWLDISKNRSSAVSVTLWDHGPTYFVECGVARLVPPPGPIALPPPPPWQMIVKASNGAVLAQTTVSHSHPGYLAVLSDTQATLTPIREPIPGFPIPRCGAR